jgi:hypothetical protein
MLTVLLALPALAADVLPVQRVRFYETGVGWFERTGLVQDTTSLPVPTSHIDDALKSLVILGGDVEVGAITFPTASGDDAARVAAGLQGDTEVGFAHALRALLGVKVTLRTDDRSITGLLLEVDGPLPVPVPEEGDEVLPQASQYALTVFGADGSLQRTTTDRLLSVTSEEGDVSARLAAATRTLGQTRAQRPNALNLDLWKGGQLSLGYLAEAPVWRVTYRVIAGEQGAELQAWALVHNDTDEAWKGVRVELANGEPDSFLYPMAAPRYAERALVTPNVDLNTVPQLAAITADDLWNDLSGPSYGIGIGGMGSGGSGYGYGAAGLGTIGVMGAAQLKEAEPVETPTQFVYRVARPLDLPAHHSALVPLVHDEVPTEAAVVFAPGATEGRTSVWLRNGTGKTLPAGVLSVLEAGGLAGETSLERLKPGETQMLQFGNELDVDLSWTVDAEETMPTKLEVDGGLITVTETSASVTTVALRNRSGRARSVWLGLALSPEAEVTGGVRTEIDPHRGWTYAILPAPTGSSEPTVRTEANTERSMEPGQASEYEYRRWAELGLADPGTLTRAADRRALLAKSEVELTELQADRTRAQAELVGLRDSLRAAEGSDGTGALTRRAASVEAESRRLDERVAEVEARLAEHRTALVDVLRALDPDAAADVQP